MGKFSKRDPMDRYCAAWYHKCIGEGFDFYVSMMGTGRIEYGSRHENVIQLSKTQVRSLFKFLKQHEGTFECDI